MVPITTGYPAILARDNEHLWLAGGPITHGTPEDMFSPRPSRDMIVTRVSDLVNNPAVDDERVVQPLASSAGMQTSLPE